MASINFNELALETIQSQYGASPRIRAVIEAFAAAIDPNGDINKFYEDIFDLDTAVGVGLDIWGVIVGVNRVLEIATDEPFGYFGSLLQPFNEGHFYGGTSGLTNNYRLTDNAFRKLIYFKAMENIMNTDADEINNLFAFLFDGKGAYVIEVGTMTIRYVFEFDLEPFEISIMNSYGIFARSAGVGFEFYIVDMAETFGFDGSGMTGFDQGGFNIYQVGMIN